MEMYCSGTASLQSFRVKLFLLELPVLSTLQCRSPNFYNPSWSCLLCNSAPEDWDHLWIYPALQSRVQNLPARIKLVFEKIIFSSA